MKNSTKFISMALAIGMTTSMIGCTSKENIQAKTEKAVESITYKDGQYEGSANGNGGPIDLKLTVSDGRISEVEVIGHKDTQILSDAAFETLLKGVVDTQSVNFDSISGATVTSYGIMAAVKDALKKAGGTDEYFKTNEKINLAKTEEKTEFTYDVVVIGAGGAGLSAAAEVKMSGASVVVLEKLSGLGGNTLVSGGGLNIPGTEQQKNLKIEDSVDLFVEDTLKGGDRINDEKLVRVIGENALETIDWLVEDVDVEFMPDRLQQFGGHSVPRALIPKNNTGVELISKLASFGQGLGVEIKTETKAEDLILKNGRVVGVKAINAGGQELTFNANKGVIIASGGFGANKELRVKYDPDKDDKYKTTDISATTGDGIIMAEKVGGDLIHMEYIQTYPTYNPKTGIISYVANSRFDGALLVNQEANRFVEEMDRRDVISKAILNQTNGQAYLVWGQEVESVGNMTEVHKDEFTNMEKQDVIFKADTLEDLAKHYDLDQKDFIASINKYNSDVDQGEDTDFNRRGELRKIKTGPFYIQKVTPSIHHTMGGLVINQDANVLDEKGNIIPGLFAAGEVTGGIHGTNRLGGNAITDVVVFGRIAGKNITK